MFVRRFFDLSPGIHVLVLFVLGLCVYASAVFHPFVHDDVVFILQNPNIQRWDNIADAFLRPSIPQIFQGLVTPYYRPVLEVIYRLEYALFGFNAHGFHLFNVLVHLLNGAMVYALVQRLFGKAPIAFMISAVFLVHPVQTEAVACVAGISNLACALFMLTSLYGYVRWGQATGRAGGLWMTVAVFSFIIALFTKEQAVVLPFICLMYEGLMRQRSAASIVARLAVLILPLAGYLILRQTLFGGFTSAIFENIGELKLRLLAIPGLIEMYAGLLIFPSGLHYYRSIDILAPYISSWIILALLIVLFFMIVRPLEAQHKKMALFGLAWFILALGPVLNIIPLVNEYSFIAAAEHNLYFPMIGFLILAAAVLNHYSTALDPAKVALGVMAIVACLSVMAFTQNRYWRGEVPLFQRAVQFEPQLGRVRILLAKAYIKEGRIDEAIKEYGLAQEIMQSYARKAATPKSQRFYQGMLKGIYSDSAQAFAFKQDWKSSVRHYDLALEIDPGDSYLYSNRALSFIGDQHMELGIRDLQKALSLNPDNLLAANNLSICYIQKGETARAQELLEYILVRDPGFTAARENLMKLKVSVKNKDL